MPFNGELVRGGASQIMDLRRGRKWCVLVLLGVLGGQAVAASAAADKDPITLVSEDDIAQLERAAAAIEKEITAIDELQALLQFIVVPDAQPTKARFVRDLFEKREKDLSAYRKRVKEELQGRAEVDLRGDFRDSVPKETLSRMRASALASQEIARILKQFMQSADKVNDTPASCKVEIADTDKEDGLKLKIETCAGDIEKSRSGPPPLKGAIETTSTALASRRGPINEELEKRRQQIALARREQSKKIDITSTAVTYTVPIVGLLMLLILLGPIVYGRDVQLAIFQNALLLELLTVYLLIATILLLGLSEKIDKNALGTLLGGISGYVLGRTLSSRTQGTTRQAPPVPESPAPPHPVPPGVP